MSSQYGLSVIRKSPALDDLQCDERVGSLLEEGPPDDFGPVWRSLCVRGLMRAASLAAQGHLKPRSQRCHALKVAFTTN